MSDLMEKIKDVINAAIRETIGEFFANPLQFHGDTGIMHYLYHRVLMRGEDVVFLKKDNRSTLLFQSEHHTKLQYRSKGARQGPGRFDFALVDPDQIPPTGELEKVPALAALEVGRNKDLSKMGDFLAAKSASDVRPGDAAKLVREMQFMDLRLGYLIELYDDPRRTFLAPEVFDKLVAAADEAELDGFHLIVAVGEPDASRHVSFYPPGWRDALAFSLEDYPGLSERPSSSEQRPRTRGFDEFIRNCGATNRELQRRIREELLTYACWGRCTMTLRKKVRITNQAYARERGRQTEELCDECDVSDGLRTALAEQDLHLGVEGTIQIPETAQCDVSFVNRVMQALRRVFQDPAQSS